MDFTSSRAAQAPEAVSPSSIPPPETKEAKGETGPAPTVTNSEFIEAVFRACPPGAVPLICSKPGDPQQGGFAARPAANVDEQCPPTHNNYFNCSSFTPDGEGNYAATKQRVAAYHALVLDDVGSKVDAAELDGVEVSWRVETSKGNFQVGFILAEPIEDAQQVERLQTAVVTRGLCDAGAMGIARWMRLPVAVNGKEKHRVAGFPFTCRLTHWEPSRTFTVDDLASTLHLNLSPLLPVSPPAAVNAAFPLSRSGDEVFALPAEENPVLTALRDRGWLKGLDAPGIHEVTCPWVHQHTDQLDDGARYFEPSASYPKGGFRCHHSHGSEYSIGNLLEFLGLSPSDARNRPRIRLVPGEINRIVVAAEFALAGLGRYYQTGGAIVTIRHKLDDVSIEVVGEHALTQALAEAADWERIDATKGWVRCDPPERCVRMLLRGQQYHVLPELRGLARQPFFREQDGELVIAPGYDSVSCIFGAFEAGAFVFEEPTIEAAQRARGRLLRLLDEFHFKDETDRAAALSAMLTASVRPSLPLAPAFNVTASTPGSGKTYLCQTVYPFAGPGEAGGISYPTSSEEAAKVILSLLMQAPAVVFFDDMTTDWQAYGPINRMLTSQVTTERILGASKTVTVGTRVLVLGSGNNIEPVRDLRRRVITIRLAPKTASPAMLKYQGSPADEVRRNRARYVSDAITIIRAWQRAGSPRADVFDIASFNGAWSDYCRHPLIWLGDEDPASSLREQLRSDPDTEALGDMLEAWHGCFGDRSVTIRTLIGEVTDLGTSDLLEAIMDLPVTDGSSINRNKLGWYLKKHRGRIARGLMIDDGDSSERKSWRVVRVHDDPGAT
jgi:hypothetical protein